MLISNIVISTVDNTALNSNRISFLIERRNKETGFTGRNIEHSHSVIATDPDLQHYIRTNLNQYDKVFVEGYLNYQQAQTDDGTRMSGNIIAVNIEKT